MLPFRKMIKMILLATILLLIGTDVVESRVETVEPVAFYPLNDEFQTKEKDGKQPPGIKGVMAFAKGPSNELNGAYQFTGKPSSFIEFPNNGGLDTRESITLMCWVQPGGQDGPLFNYRNTGPWGVHIWIVNGRFFNRITKYPNHAFARAILTDKPLLLGKWVHVAATFDHSTGVNSLYVNGQLSTTQNIGTGFEISTNDAQVRMGVKIGDGRYFTGRIAQMKVYDVALNKEQIKVAMKEGLSTCHDALGMENGNIRNSQISASSQWNANHAAIQGRLNFKKNGIKQGGWSARANNANQWLQVDLGSKFSKVTRVATQGRNVANQWVTKYTLQYSNDGVQFQYYKESGQTNRKEFAGNTNRNTIVSHPLNPPITARFIRFRPIAWRSHISMRVELYGCKAQPVAFYPLNEKFQANEKDGKQPNGITQKVTTTNGPNNERNGAYQFSGTSNSFIEFPNNGGLDTRHSITLMCWVQPGGKDGPLFNYRKSGPWGVHMWIVSGRFFNRITKYPNHAFTNAIATDQPLSVGHWNHVAATYDHNTGVNSLYVNGYLSKTQNIGTGYEISTNDAEVRMGVKDGDNRFFNGKIAQMKVFDFALDEHQIEATMNEGHSRHLGLSTCHNALGMENGDIRNNQIKASSQWDANHAAIQGRLNFKKNGIKQGGWSARANNANQWLQVDLVSKFTKVTRVATQGRNVANQWVTKYMLQYSNDGLRFQYYRGEGEATYREFVGNTDQNTIVAHHLNPPIEARYIRFLPKSWNNHISMRVEVYGCRVCQKPLGMEDGRISNGQISASSQWNANHAAIQGRLNFKKTGSKQGAWSALANNANQWLQVDLGCRFTRVTRVATQGRNAVNQWVTKYMLQFGNDGLHFQYYRQQDKPNYKVFAGNTDQNTIVSHLLTSPISARYIRFRPLAWHAHISMRVELYGCKGCKHCKGALGMENRAISDNQISASSQWDANHAAIQGRLFYQAAGSKQGAWSARTNDVNQWLQVQLGSMFTKITYVATQGRNAADQWVTKYMLQYSKDGVHFLYYSERGQNANKELIGNTDRDTVVYHELNPPIKTRYIRFRPLAWHRHISMRVELYGCEECNKALGMQNRAISNWQVTASSQWNANHAAIQGRLFYPAAGSKQGAWSARINDVNQWLQIDLSCNDNIVTRVATQGRNAVNQWVTKYMLQYSTDGVHFQYYKLQGQAQNKEFPGNTDRDTVVSHQLNPPIKAQYIRFRPRAWKAHISMRVELYGCKDPK